MEDTDQDWDEIDTALFAGRMVPAVRCVTDRRGVGLQPAIDILYERWLLLIQERPTEFTASLEWLWTSSNRRQGAG